jgi:hypothetical protein
LLLLYILKWVLNIIAVLGICHFWIGKGSSGGGA